MFRFWEKFDFVYQQTASYRQQMRHFNLGRRFVHHLCTVKTEHLNAQLVNSGYDQLTNEQHTNQLTYMHKCLLAFRQGRFTAEQLHDEVETIFIGGIDTTATAITNTMMMLAMHPTVQDRVRAELRNVLGPDFDICQHNVLLEHTFQLTYMAQVIHESLRLLPAGPYLSRTCTGPLKLSKRPNPFSFKIVFNFHSLHIQRTVQFRMDLWFCCCSIR